MSTSFSTGYGKQRARLGGIAARAKLFDSATHLTAASSNREHHLGRLCYRRFILRSSPEELVDLHVVLCRHLSHFLNLDDCSLTKEVEIARSSRLLDSAEKKGKGSMLRDSCFDILLEKSRANAASSKGKGKKKKSGLVAFAHLEHLGAYGCVLF